MNTLTQRDLNFVVRRIPRDIRTLMTEFNLYLAGGFIRETISGGEVKDIDLFGENKDSLKAHAMLLAERRGAKWHQTDNALTVICPPRMPVQFITRWVFDTPDGLVKSFDFTVCQAVIWFDKATKEWTSQACEDFYPDLSARRLVYTFPIREEEAGGSMLRVRKFLSRGYSIQADSLAGVIARLSLAVKPNELPLRGDESPENIEKATAKVISGLLREVDPLLIVDGLEPIDEHDERQI